MKTYMHDERHRIEEGWAMGRPPRPIEPDYDGDGEPIFDDGKLGDGMDFGRIYEPHTFADSPEECRQLSEEMAEEVQTREEMAQRIERLERALYFVAEKVEGASTGAEIVTAEEFAQER